MNILKSVLTLILLISTISANAQQPSNHDLELQREGILDKNFRYTNSPKVSQLYRDTTAVLNQSTPVNMGDGVKMIQALQMPSIAIYTYSLPIQKNQFTPTMERYIKQQAPTLKTTFCYQVNKHIHYKVNNRQEKYIYVDRQNQMLTEITLKASQC
ncbi:hypothetical protein HX127_06370 [Acinetobacter sp. 256-1]|uniref:hypothetical protein n=1 Tax=Acinetobacter sp. 256-1 TaxID=2746721 RepID=UPI0025784470|nr:hypothetical protein [Acinetobacter sp. 256-1]MDM1757209.1 hypothetical protein [Acinetobacter sp. 256-1]